MRCHFHIVPVQTIRDTENDGYIWLGAGKGQRRGKIMGKTDSDVSGTLAVGRAGNQNYNLETIEI